MNIEQYFDKYKKVFDKPKIDVGKLSKNKTYINYVNYVLNTLNELNSKFDTKIDQHQQALNEFIRNEEFSQNNVLMSTIMNMYRDILLLDNVKEAFKIYAKYSKSKGDVEISESDKTKFLLSLNIKLNVARFGEIIGIVIPKEVRSMYGKDYDKKKFKNKDLQVLDTFNDNVLSVRIKKLTKQSLDIKNIKISLSAKKELKKISHMWMSGWVFRRKKLSKLMKNDGFKNYDLGHLHKIIELLKDLDANAKNLTYLLIDCDRASLMNSLNSELSLIENKDIVDLVMQIAVHTRNSCAGNLGYTSEIQVLENVVNKKLKEINLENNIQQAKYNR